MVRDQSPDMVDNGLDRVWLEFVEAATTRDFCWNWLILQCNAIRGVEAGMVLVATDGGSSYAPVAVWPDSSRNLQHLAPTAERALAGRQGVVAAATSSESSGGRGFHVAYPVDISGKLQGVVVLEVSDRTEADLEEALRQLHWGIGWLEAMFRRQGEAEGKDVVQRVAGVLELATTVVQPGSFRKVAMDLVNETATRLRCHRVGLGRLKRDFVQLVAISHSSNFDRKTNLVQTIEAAMEEALDQGEILRYPVADERAVVVRLHEELVHRFGGDSVCTVPLPGREGMFGALTLERVETGPFTDAELEFCRAFAGLIGPMLDIHYRNDQWPGARVGSDLHRTLAKLFGPRHLVLKSLTALAVFAFLAVCLIRTEYRVTAKTVLEGSMQRVVSAPFDGFLQEAFKKAGDTVSAGEVLCRLDDRDLRLEQLKWASEAEQYQRKYQEALANHDRAAARIAEAQTKQAHAELALLGEKLARASIAAPIDGILASGDLSQRLGTPVRLGDELFKLVPLERYRLILQVDEREIVHVRTGSRGELVLSGLPRSRQPFRVSRMTPVSTAEGGRNYFRVEASLLEQSELLRPGMEGIGKIDSGKRSLLWIWSHGLTDWFRLWIWSWWL